MNSFLCKNCNHLQADHRIGNVEEQDSILSSLLKYKELCWVTLRDGTYCDCLKFQYKNLDYLEMKYEESQFLFNLFK